ncbi:MAG: deoxyribonuclease V [Planctomycetota bacterium]
MNVVISHRWPRSPTAAIRLQERLRQRVIPVWDGRVIRTIAGVDVSVKDNRARAAIVVLSFPDLAPAETATAETSVKFPYVPGLLSFREIPVILRAWRRLRVMPDLLFVDGQGRAHPRRFGIACHLGVILDRPAIGVGKTRLCGTHDEPEIRRGSRVPLRDGREVIGTVLRTRDGVRPLYVSIGHRVDAARAVKWVLACATRYRLPEPIRAAHTAAGITHTSQKHPRPS